MELKWLEDFVTLADTSSFSRSAELRNVTQPAFSRRIKQLEVWLGAPLINRGTMPAELTPAGRNFLPLARDTIRALYAAQEALRPTSESGMARFAALHTLTVTFVPAWLQLLEQEMPDIRISLIPDRGGIEANLATLVDGEADFFLTYAHPRVPFHLDRERFDYLSVGSDRLMPVVAPEVRLQRDRWVPGEGLLDRAVKEGISVPYLSYGFSSFFGVALGRLFAERPQFLRRQVHENAISAGLKTVALTGAGLCWLPQSLIQAELDAGLLVNASATTDWTMDLEIRLYRHLGSQSKLVKNFWRSAEALLRRQLALPAGAAGI
ncbi:LysR family transcriptional regulator [Rhizobium sp. S95]|uniref:LysR family transcriptional regulator n=1 Tax=Ciceribacter sichuanensis TaxID=2949647 RepID=A0AAJ1C1U4_9HYPH|nr:MULTISPECIES: LysR family transcriptional regulator [unclassified Ciceribacter]MCM2397821.1 LysR family transcriptional regulator [Ciceribacter sp. S95]MCM2404378.1 LysR family transcriptional regulator [Ciceribacter sp. S153]MCO5960205.1 LysR family transcriptional regulator [Ciceribacter sp. S101]